MRACHVPVCVCVFVCVCVQAADVWDVVVVVSRWFGGVLLGPQRFALINNTARQLLEAQVR